MFICKQYVKCQAVIGLKKRAFGGKHAFKQPNQLINKLITKIKNFFIAIVFL